MIWTEWIQENLISFSNIIGLIGLLVTLYTYWDSKKTKLLGYRVNSVILVSRKMSSIKELEINYSGKSISELTISTILIKNCGSKIIESNDLSKQSPLQVKSEGEILSVNECDDQYQADGIYGLTVSQIDEKTVQLDFEYIKPSGLVALQILHTGKIAIIGNLKEGDILSSESPRIVNPLLKYALYVPFWTIVLLFAICIFCVWANPPARIAIHLFIVDAIVFTISSLLIPTIRSRLKGMIDI